MEQVVNKSTESNLSKSEILQIIAFTISECQRFGTNLSTEEVYNKYLNYGSKNNYINIGESQRVL